MVSRNFRTKVGRFYRYNVHEPLVNFMAPEPMVLPPMASKLFSNLFGQRTIAPVSWKCTETIGLETIGWAGGSYVVEYFNVQTWLSDGFCNYRMAGHSTSHSVFLCLFNFFSKGTKQSKLQKLQSQSLFCNWFLHYAWRSIVVEELRFLYPGDVEVVYVEALWVMRIGWCSSSSSGNAFLNVLNDLLCVLNMGVELNAHFLYIILRDDTSSNISLRSIFSSSNTWGKILWWQQTTHCEGTTKKNHHETRKCSPWYNCYTPKWDTSTCELIRTMLLCVDLFFTN